MKTLCIFHFSKFNNYHQSYTSDILLYILSEALFNTLFNDMVFEELLVTIALCSKDTVKQLSSTILILSISYDKIHLSCQVLVSI